MTENHNLTIEPKPHISEVREKTETELKPVWDYFFEHIEVSDDFMNQRNQPMSQEREELFP